MSFFDRLLGRRPRLDRLPTPWGDRPPIYEAVRAAARPDGSLPNDFELPDESGRAGELRWAPGALDGVMSHHAGPADTDARAAGIAEAVVALTERASEAHLETLQERVTTAPLLDCVDELASALMRTPDLDADRLHDVGRFLATRAADREMVKLGLAILGLVEGLDDRDLLLALGAHDELTLFSVVALTNRPDATERDLWKLAQRARGWGRIQSVERLEGTSDPAIQKWMLEEGFRNEVMDEYLAHLCATSGRLLEALEGPADDALLAGAAGILEALVEGGPAPGLEEYEEGAAAAERFLDHVAERAGEGSFDLALLGAVVRLRAFIEEDRDWRPLASFGWTADLRDGLARVAGAILSRPEWEANVRQALDAREDRERYRGEHLARLLAVDTFDRTCARLEREPVDAPGWFDLLRQVDSPERLALALALADRLPLDAIASGPAEELGLGPAYAAHGCLDALLQDLGRFPGQGWPLVRAGLRSPVVRNRNMALRALAQWPRGDWPEAARAALEAARDAEPSEEVRQRMEAALEGRRL